MGLLPFLVLAAAAKKSQESSHHRSSRSSRDRDDDGYYKSSNDSGYRYYSPSQLKSVELEDIQDEQTRAFVEGLFALRQKRLDEHNDKLREEIKEKEDELEKLEAENIPMIDREQKAKAILDDSMDKIQGRETIARAFMENPYYDTEPSSDYGRTLKKIFYSNPFDNIQQLARNGHNFSLNFNLEALQGVPLEDSTYYKTLLDFKRNFYKDIAQLEQNLESLQKQLKHTIWIPKRKDLKLQIEKLSTKIEKEKAGAPALTKVIDLLCDFYKEVGTLDQESKKAITDAMEDEKSGKKRENYYGRNRATSKIGYLKKEIENPADAKYDKLIREYVLEHPEITEETLEHVRKGLKDAEEQKREAVGKETHVYDYGPTSIAHEIKTDDLCRLLQYDASYAIRDRDKEMGNE